MAQDNDTGGFVWKQWYWVLVAVLLIIVGVNGFLFFQLRMKLDSSSKPTGVESNLVVDQTSPGSPKPGSEGNVYYLGGTAESQETERMVKVNRLTITGLDVAGNEATVEFGSDIGEDSERAFSLVLRSVVRITEQGPVDVEKLHDYFKTGDVVDILMFYLTPESAKTNETIMAELEAEYASEAATLAKLQHYYGDYGTQKMTEAEVKQHMSGKHIELSGETFLVAEMGKSKPGVF